MSTGIDDPESVVVRRRLEAELHRLRSQLQQVTTDLAIERAERYELQRSIDQALVRAERIEVLEDGSVRQGTPGGEGEGEGGEAFDDFFATPDPHLDKVRRFLLG